MCRCGPLTGSKTSFSKTAHGVGSSTPQGRRTGARGPRTTSRPPRPARTRARGCRGRKRGVAVDALGLIIAVVVTAASVTDNAIGIRLLDKVAEHTPTVTVAWVDAGLKQDVGVHGALVGIDVEVVKRSDTQAGFVPVKKRWIVDQVRREALIDRVGVRDLHRRPVAAGR